MPLLPLLPKTKGQEWPPQATEGLHSISDVDYQRNLCEDYYEASDFGTPSPLAYPIVFRDRLLRYLEDRRSGVNPPRFLEAFRLWSLLLKGMYFGLVSVRTLRAEELRDIGGIVFRELPEGYRLAFLLFEGEIVGLTFPGIGLAPSVRLSAQTEARLTAAVAGVEADRAAEYFGTWALEEADRAVEDLPFYDLLRELVRQWSGPEVKPLPQSVDKLFAEGPRIDLTDWSGGQQELLVRHFVGTPIFCENCGYELGKTAGVLEIRNPEDCRCPNCSQPHDWLAEYAGWVRFDVRRGEYLIYAFEGSPMRQAPTDQFMEEADGVRIASGRLFLKVFGLVLSEERLKCDRLLFFRDDGNVHQPHLPVRGEYFGLVERVRTGEPARTDPYSRDWVVPLEVQGWDRRVTLRYSPEEIHTEEALLLTWPRFRMEGWNAYFFLLEATPQLNRAGISLRSLRRDRRPEGLEGTRGMTREPFEALEIVFRLGDRLQQAGLYIPDREVIPRGSAPVTVALDFGTSSSALWYRVGDADPEVLRFRDFTETLIPNRSLSDHVLDSSSWLPTYRLDDAPTALRFYSQQLDGEAPIDRSGQQIVERMSSFLPSEIITHNGTSNRQLEQPLLSFRICHAYGAQPDGLVRFEIKSMPVDGDLKGGFSFSQIVVSYLEMLLVLALASISQQEQRAGFLVVRSSFPRAFSPKKIRLYHDCLSAVFQRVEALTGFVTNKSYSIDEARAAAYSMRAPGDTVLVMDMGGGTTDIGVFDWKDGTLDPVFIDSLQYGGNDFLHLLVKEASLFPKPTEKQANRLLWLVREIRLRSFAEVMRTQYAGNQTARRQTADLLVQFYKPIVYFVRRLFEALPHQGREFSLESDPITLYLVGNGWSLADAIPVVDMGFGTNSREIFKRLLQAEGFQRLRVADEPSFNGRRRWPGPKAAVGYGAITASPHDLYEGVEKALEERQGIRSVVGFDMKVDDGSKRRTDVAWHEAVPFQMEGQHDRPVLTDIEIPKDWSFLKYDEGRARTLEESIVREDIEGVEKPRLRRSVLGRFIETVYLEQLDQAKRI
jgi:hypothetical protein